MNRRRFIQMVGVAGAAAPEFKVTAKDLPKRLRVAIAGGGAAGTAVAAWIRASDVARVVAIIDPARDRARRLWGDSRDPGGYLLRADYSNLTDALDAARPDAVVLAVPDHCQAKLVRECTRREIPVLVRAPLCHSLSELAELAHLPNPEKLHVAVAAPADVGLTELSRLISSGAIGTVHRATIFVSLGGGRRERPTALEVPPGDLDWARWCADTGPAPYLPSVVGRTGKAEVPGWRWHLRYGNGPMGALAPHWIAAVCAVHAWPQPEKCYSIGRRPVLGRPVAHADGSATSNAPDHQIAWLRFPNGDVTWEHRLTRGKKDPSDDHALVCGTHGVAQLRADGRWSITGRRDASGSWIAPADQPRVTAAICAHFFAAIGANQAVSHTPAGDPATEWVLWSMATLQAGRTLDCQTPVAV